MKRFIFPFVISFLITMIFSSCVKKKFDFDRISPRYEWEPNLAVPGVKADLTLRDILQDYDSTELFVYDETGFVYIMYHSQIFSAKASDFIIIPDQSFPNDIFLGQEFIDQNFPASVSSATVTHNVNLNFSFQSADMDIDSILIKSTDLNIAVTSQFQHTGNVIVTFPTVKKNGVPYSKTITVNTNDGNFSLSNFYTDLNGYTIDFTGTNQLPVEIAATYYDSGNTLNSSDQVTVHVGFLNMYYSAMFGYTGQDTLSYSDTVHLEIFNHVFEGHANFVDPKFHIHINNSYGVPIAMLFDDLETYSTQNQTNQTFTFTTNNTYNPYLVGYPSVSQFGQTVASGFTLDKNNSSVVNIINTTPKYIFFNVHAMTNPAGPATNFITDESQFDLDMEVELPCWGNAEFFVLQDTTPLNMQEIYGDLDVIEWLKLRINVDNGMPAEVGLQIYFCETDTVIAGTDTTINYIPVDSAFTPQTMEIVQSGVLDANGKVSQSTYKRTELYFDKDRIANLQDVKYVFFRGYVYTTNHASQDVRFYADYHIDIRVGLQAQFHFDDTND